MIVNTTVIGQEDNPFQIVRFYSNNRVKPYELLIMDGCTEEALADCLRIVADDLEA